MFAEVNEENVNGFLEGIHSKSTRRTAENSVKMVKLFLGADSEVETFEKQTLNQNLKVFVTYIHQKSGETSEQINII